MHAFEIGHVYLPDPNAQLPIEQARLGIVLTGPRHEDHWSLPKAQVDLFDLKGILESIFNYIGMRFELFSDVPQPFLQNHSATISISKKKIGWFGKITSEIVEKYDIQQDVFVAELLLDELLGSTSDQVTFKPLSAFPPSLRDMAVLVDTTVAAQSILDCAKAAGGKHLQDIRLFDVYSGKQVPAGKKSLALNLVFQSHERTLTDKDTQKAWDNILKTLEQKFGATLRG